MDSTSNFRLFRKNGRILKPKLIREGRVLFWDRTGDGVTNRPHICVKNRNINLSIIPADISTFIKK